ncbi:MAG: HD domain-containing protein [Anaerolineae bacterium]
MKRVEGYSEKYDEGLRVATVEHGDQTRKGSGLPYVVHPMHVSVILLRHGFSQDAAIAGLLHDVVEDQGYSLAEIEARFGARVAEMVAVLSERKSDTDGVQRPWELRKQEALQRLRAASRETVAVKCADTLHNARSFVDDLRQQGPAVWQHFNRGPQLQLTYYNQVVELARERLGAHALVTELAEAVTELASAIDDTGTT